MDSSIFDDEDFDPECYSPEEDEEEEEVGVEGKSICPTCNGSGESPFSFNGICHYCHGRGTR